MWLRGCARGWGNDWVRVSVRWWGQVGHEQGESGERGWKGNYHLQGVLGPCCCLHTGAE